MDLFAFYFIFFPYLFPLFLFLLSNIYLLIHRFHSIPSKLEYFLFLSCFVEDYTFFTMGLYPMETRVLVQTLETQTEATESTSEGTDPICGTFASRRPPEPPPDLRFFHTPPPPDWCRAVRRPPSPSVWYQSKTIEARFLGTYVCASPRYARVAEGHRNGSPPPSAAGPPRPRPFLHGPWSCRRPWNRRPPEFLMP